MHAETLTPRASPPELLFGCTTDILRDGSHGEIWRMYSKARNALPHRERIENMAWRLMAMASRSAALPSTLKPPPSPVPPHSAIEITIPACHYENFNTYEGVDDNDYLSQLKRITEVDTGETGFPTHTSAKRLATALLSPESAPMEAITDLGSYQFNTHSHPHPPFAHADPFHVSNTYVEEAIPIGPIEEFAKSYSENAAGHFPNGISIKRASTQDDYYARNLFTSPNNSATSSYLSASQDFSYLHQSSFTRRRESITSRQEESRGISRTGSLSAFPPPVPFPGSTSASSLSHMSGMGLCFSSTSNKERNATLLVANGFHLASDAFSTPSPNADKPISAATASVDRYMEQHYVPVASYLSTPSDSHTNLHALNGGRNQLGYAPSQAIPGNDLFRNPHFSSYPSSQPGNPASSGSHMMETPLHHSLNGLGGNLEYLQQLSDMSTSLNMSLRDLASPDAVSSFSQKIPQLKASEAAGTTKAKPLAQEEAPLGTAGKMSRSITGKRCPKTEDQALKKETRALHSTPYQPPSNCSNCNTCNTPLWRRAPGGEPLCNACGLFLKLHGIMRPLSLKTDVIKKRQRHTIGTDKEAAGVPPTSVPPVKEGNEVTGSTTSDGDNLNPPGIDTPSASHTANWDSGGEITLASLSYHQPPDLVSLKNLAHTPQLLLSTVFSISLSNLSAHEEGSNPFSNAMDSGTVNIRGGTSGIEDADIDMLTAESSASLHNANLDWLMR